VQCRAAPELTRPRVALQNASACVSFEGRNSALFVHELPTEMLTKLRLLAGSRLEREDRNMPGYADFAHRHHGDFPGASARLKCAFVSLTPQVQPDGAAIFVGTSSGAILEWTLPAQVRKRRIVVVVSEH